MNESTHNEHFTMFGLGYENRNGVAVPASRPKMTVDIGYVYHYIKDGWAERATQKLRQLMASTDNDEQQRFKKLNFETVTFAGRFSYRDGKHLIGRSPFMVLDVDHLGTLEEALNVKQLFINDAAIETALCFVSPRGEGIKWVVRLPEWCEGLTFREQFLEMRKYVAFTHGIAIDDSGKEVNRVCYLPSDKDCYVNEKYLINTLYIYE